MFRKILAIMMVAVAAGLAGVLGLGPVAAQQGPSATRSISPTTVETNGAVVVTITTANHGDFGRVEETLPDGFEYVTSSRDRVTESVVNGRTVLKFTFLGAIGPFTYTVTASDTADTYTFRGIVTDGDTESPVSGRSSVTVEAPAQQGPSATRSISPTTVETNGAVVVTITTANHGDFGRVEETLPDGFEYVTSSRDRVTESVVNGRTVLKFTFLGAIGPFTYTVTASDTADTYTFRGIVTDGDTESPVSGRSSVTVEAPAQQGPSATRSISPTTVETNGAVVVTITTADHGEFGRVEETLPDGFEYVTSSRDRVTESVVNGRTVLKFTFLGAIGPFTYTVTASDTADTYTFRGIVTDGDTESPVSGRSSVTVRAAPPTQPQPQPPGNTAPVFRTAPAVSVGENTTTVTAVRAEDRDSQDRVTGYDITGGADQDKFSLTTTRVLSFKTAPDFEDPTDADADNRYMVEVTATSGTGSRERTATRTFTVTVTNQDEAGRVTFWRDGADATTAAIRVGDMLTGLAEDPDGNAGDMPPMADMYTQITGATWQWARSMTPTMMDSWMDIADATDAMYTVTDDDDGYYLQATAMYNDGEGADKMAYEMTASAVSTPPLDMCIEELTSLPMTVMDAWAADCNSEARSGSYARYYSFTLTQAGQVEINLTSGADSYLALRQGESRDGAVVEENDNVRSRNFNSSINRMLDAGAYTVEATTYFAGQTGDFTLSVRPLQETEVLGTLTGSVDRSNSRWTSDHMSTQQEGSYARSYTFTLAAATHVAINLTAPEDPYLFLLDSSGMVLHESDNITTRNLNSRIDETLQPGTYTIEATTYFPARMGTFHLSIGVIP